MQAYLSDRRDRPGRENVGGRRGCIPATGSCRKTPDLVDACTEAGIAFIGPKADTMRALGDKASARRVAIAAGVPVIPATEVLGGGHDEDREQAEEVGYPLMLKASWGGGGRGMRPIKGPEELEEKVRERPPRGRGPPSATARAISRR